MNTYTFVITIVTETFEQAEEVLAERLDYDEDYGFPYEIASSVILHRSDG